LPPQVELYADYDQRFLLPFLRSSSFYPLEKAYETCKARGLTREVVFILGRMGNSREALGLIIEELHDMDQVSTFLCWCPICRSYLAEEQSTSLRLLPCGRKLLVLRMVK
jgi:hypothetical protein